MHKNADYKKYELLVTSTSQTQTTCALGVNLEKALYARRQVLVVYELLRQPLEKRL